MRWAICIILLACNSNTDDPASYITGLRVLGVKAEPPEVPAGGTTTLTPLALDTDGNMINASWSFCTAPPLQGQPINPACVLDGGSALVTVATGVDPTLQMPDIHASDLGRPDNTGGYYVPLLAEFTAGSSALAVLDPIRLGVMEPYNQNPTLTNISQVTNPNGDAGAEVLVPLDDSAPLVVHANDTVILRAGFADGSAETYSYAGVSITEMLSVSWFSTAGTFARADTGADVPDTIFHLDQIKNGPTVHLPQSGATIDLWLVGRDDRGGLDYLHKTLLFE